MQIATEELAQVLNLNSCQVELYDSQQLKASIVHEHNVTLPPCQGETRQINDFPELYHQLLQKSPLQLVEAIPQFNPSGIQVSRLACPIFDARGIMGNLWGLTPPGEVYTSFEIRLMQQVASQCAIAIRQARLYADSNRQVAELAKLNQLKNDFFKTISHELKAPMSSIQLAAQTLDNLLNNTKNPRKSPLFERVLKIFYDSCQRQKQLVDDLLTLCYINAEAKAIQPEALELNSWLNNLTQLYAERIQNKQQELILDLSSKEINLTIDPLILNRIIRELLNNACKYTPAGGTISTKTRLTESEISLSIINSGAEISSEEQELIFDQFYRIPTNDPWQYGGTGLGLTLVRKLVEILGATINVESDRNRTIFCVKFPR
ncbi:MAG: ATP-binding protein [Pleurocapsa sp.]